MRIDIRGEVLLPNKSMIMSLFSVENQPRIFKRNENNVNGVMWRIDRLFNNEEKRFQKLSKTNEFYCE